MARSSVFATERGAQVDSEQAAIQKLDREEKARTIYWFKVPPRLATLCGISRLGFVELTGGEMDMAINRSSGGSQAKLTIELTKESMRFMDDKAVNTGDGSADAFWGNKRQGFAQMRELALLAYGKVHHPDKEEAVDFLGSLSLST